MGALLAAGGVGSYVFATRTTGTDDVTFGSTLAGSSLSPTSAAYKWSVETAPNSAAMDTGSVLSGTWRCMGHFDYLDEGTGGMVDAYGATLWLRVA